RPFGLRRAAPLKGRRVAFQCSTAAIFGALGRASGPRRSPPVGPRSGAAPAAPSSPPRAAPNLGQPVLMPAGGCAGPPERGVTSPARGRRRPPHVQQCPAGTPLAWGGYA